MGRAADATEAGGRGLGYGREEGHSGCEGILMHRKILGLCVGHN